MPGPACSISHYYARLAVPAPATTRTVSHTVVPMRRMAASASPLHWRYRSNGRPWPRFLSPAPDPPPASPDTVRHNADRPVGGGRWPMALRAATISKFQRILAADRLERQPPEFGIGRLDQRAEGHPRARWPASAGSARSRGPRSPACPLLRPGCGGWSSHSSARGRCRGACVTVRLRRSGCEFAPAQLANSPSSPSEMWLPMYVSRPPTTPDNFASLSSPLPTSSA